MKKPSASGTATAAGSFPVFNPVTARVLLVFQLILFFGGLVGMIFVLHQLPDAAQLEQAAAARMEHMP